MAAMTPEQRHLIQRVRALVDEEPDVREVSMLGGRAIMVNDKMIVSAGKTGDLLVRVDAERHGARLDHRRPRGRRRRREACFLGRRRHELQPHHHRRGIGRQENMSAFQGLQAVLFE